MKDFAVAKRLAWSLGAMLSLTVYATSWLQKAANVAGDGFYYPRPIVISYGIILSFLLVVCLAPLLLRFHRRAYLLIDQLAPLTPACDQPAQLALRKSWSESLGLAASDGLQAAALSLAPIITATLSVAADK